MLLQTLFETSYVTIAYDHQNEWLYAEWRGNQDMKSVQQGAIELMRLLPIHHCHKVLNDNTLVTSMWSEAAEWGGTEWFPAMIALGLEYFAWVYSPNVYSRLSTDLTLQFTSATPVVATFDDIKTAKAWLSQV
ncbi:hypothetical protein [Hymenobacter glacialis]|uniref:STAS/SEC14 domain-containing protein n=1 Tax=Hymenobacter glacialis TaxID=1908236 RepID=A0A1G1T8S6_9BACT|nr:hypothetical protein [Hymenobacter glacialis]OGX87244.1 hypothetical protein BEN48_11690 [Hymenobacter glacialis]